MKRSEFCNGDRITQLRVRQGLSQVELAKKAGYSERLIRKAESGKAITFAAIRHIAMALSQNDEVVHFEDLVCNPTQLTQQFIYAFSTFETGMLPLVESFLDEKFSLYCAGDREKIPFAGEWHGLYGLEQWVQSYFRTLTRPQKDFYKPELISYDNTVIAWGHDLAHVADIPHPPMWVTQKFVFSAGKLMRFENLFDTDSSSKHLAKARAKTVVKIDRNTDQQIVA